MCGSPAYLVEVPHRQVCQLIENDWETLMKTLRPAWEAAPAADTVGDDKRPF